MTKDATVTDAAPLPIDNSTMAKNARIEDRIIEHMILRQVAGHAVPVYVVNDRSFVSLVLRCRVDVKRDALGAYCELHWFPTVPRIRAGGPHGDRDDDIRLLEPDEVHSTFGARAIATLER